MRKIMILLIGVTLLLSLFGCSKQPKEPTLNLIN